MNKETQTQLTNLIYVQSQIIKQLQQISSVLLAINNMRPSNQLVINSAMLVKFCNAEKEYLENLDTSQTELLKKFAEIENAINAIIRI